MFESRLQSFAAGSKVECRYVWAQTQKCLLDPDCFKNNEENVKNESIRKSSGSQHKQGCIISLRQAVRLELQ